MNTKTLLGVSFAAVFAISMISMGALNFAEAENPQGKSTGPPSLRIDEANTSGYTITTEGPAAKNLPKDDKVWVYGFVTDSVDMGNAVVYVVASHNFCDDDEQDIGLCPHPDDPDHVDNTGGDYSYHAHKLGLNPSTLCVETLTIAPDAVFGANTVGITGPPSENVVAWLTAQYEFTPDGLCPTHIFDEKGF